jgi:hypothetical protein
MARTTVIQLIDDIDGSEADRTVSFAYNGKRYSLDLNENNALSWKRYSLPTSPLREGRRCRVRSSGCIEADPPGARPERVSQVGQRCRPEGSARMGRGQRGLRVPSWPRQGRRLGAVPRGRALTSPQRKSPLAGSLSVHQLGLTSHPGRRSRGKIKCSERVQRQPSTPCRGTTGPTEHQRISCIPGFASAGHPAGRAPRDS